MLVPLVLSFLRPCASLENSFEHPLIQYLLSDTFINFLYPRMFPVVASSTAFILRRGLIDESEARLIYCWTEYCNISVKFIVLKAA